LVMRNFFCVFSFTNPSMVRAVVPCIIEEMEKDS
jgi:hypothetical protein